MATLIVLLVILIGFSVRLGKAVIIGSLPVLVLGAALGTTLAGGRLVHGLAGFLDGAIAMVATWLG